MRFVDFSSTGVSQIPFHLREKDLQPPLSGLPLGVVVFFPLTPLTFLPSDSCEHRLYTRSDAFRFEFTLSDPDVLWFFPDLLFKISGINPQYYLKFSYACFTFPYLLWSCSLPTFLRVQFLRIRGNDFLFITPLGRPFL